MDSSPAMIAANREVLIDGRPLRVLDGDLRHVGDYVRGLSLAGYRYTEIARPETAEYRYWATEVSPGRICHAPRYFCDQVEWIAR